MSYGCCGREFQSLRALHQHQSTAAAHIYQSSSSESSRYSSPEPQYDWECNNCNRGFSTEQSLHQHNSSVHKNNYCIPCKRMFMNSNNLMQHQHSKAHVGTAIQCPGCKLGYSTASGLVIHLESGSCPSGLNRTRINEIVRELDRGNVITRPMLTYNNFNTQDNLATEAAWNGCNYQCYLCSKTTSSLQGLNNHLRSPAHEQNLYHCPKIGCRRPFKVLSGLVQHVESESCGVMRFAHVQSQARNGVQNFIGRMIQM